MPPALDRVRKAVATGGLFLLGACAPASEPASPGGATPTPVPTGRVLFADEFDGSALGPDWVALERHGDYSNDEIQCYVPANVSVSAGNLAILSTAQARSCGDSLHAPSSSRFSSGMVQWRSFSFKYGTLEFRAKLAGGEGTWPAVWLLGADCQATNPESADNHGTCNWPQRGSDEIDVLDVYRDKTTVWHNLITAAEGSRNCTDKLPDASGTFHVYQLVWSPGELVWKIDGRTTCLFSSGIPATPMFLMINTALGGAGGPVNEADLPQTTLVDYVRVTQP